MNEETDSASAPPPAPQSLPEAVKARQAADLALVDARMGAIADKRADLKEQDSILQREQSELRTTRAALANVLHIPARPAKRAEKTAVTPPVEKPAKRVKEGAK